MRHEPNELTLANFEPLLGDEFTLVPADGGNAVPAKLIEAEASKFIPPENVKARRDPFILLFEVGGELGQGTYTVSHETLGETSLFLTCVLVPGEMDRGVRFMEAILA